MNTNRAKFWYLITIFTVCLASMSPAAQADNPYKEGVTRKKLSEAERASLMLYASNAKAQLERAVRQAQGKPLMEANGIYLAAIKQVVAESYQERRRSELLMRITLNQALELTFGVPQANGSGVVAEGVLIRVGNQDLLTVILEDSIGLALQYYQDDREAIEKGNLINLPYTALAQEHLQLGRSWLAGVNEWSLQLAFSIALLEQWQTSVLQEDHMTQARIAETILDVEDALKQVHNTQYSTQQKVRFFRGTIERVMAVRIPGVSRGTGSVGSVVDAALGAFVRIPRGKFLMGSPSGEENRASDEGQREVTLSRDFEMKATEVTQAEWAQVMGSNPSNFSNRENCPNQYKEQNGIKMCPNHPVETVSWNEVKLFLDRLNSQKRDGYTYRLPTEAEWEYAARAGSKTAYSFGDNHALLPDYAWFTNNSNSQTKPVATKKPNAWGLFDMHGNVWEWIEDWYSSYSQGPITDPAGPAAGSSRVLRGGCWYSFARGLRSADRSYVGPDDRFHYVGFRFVRTR